MKPIKIAGTFSAMQAKIMHALLVEDGFHPAPLLLHSHVSVGGGETGWYIEVPEEEASSARALLRDRGHGKNIMGESEASAR